jgi:hypothetical protein
LSDLDISNLTYSDTRPEKKRKHRRSRGWRPPQLINVNIMIESYDLIRSLAVARGLKGVAFYEQISELIKEYLDIKSEIELKQGFLDLALQDRQKLKKELESLKVKLDISKLQDQRVIFGDNNV